MSDWRKFLDDVGAEMSVAWNTFTHQPGEVMICFVNRYLEGLDGIKYKIKHRRGVVEARTTPEKYCVTISPKSFDPIEIYVWSRMSNAYKKLDNVVPNVGSKKLVRKVLKTYKTHGKTELHPKNKPIATPPEKPAPAPAAGPSPTSNQGVKPTPKKDESDLPQTQVDRPVPDKITKEQLKKIFPAAADKYLAQVADELNADLKGYGLNTPLRRAHFFAQVREEAGAKLVANEESLNYTPQALKKFKYYKNHLAEAQQDGRLDAPKIKGKRTKPLRAADQIAIANKAYAKRGGNGDVDTGDGWRYRGRGFIQLTFKSGYEQFHLDYGKLWKDAPPDLIAHPEQVKDFPYNIRSAVWFWVTNGLPKISDEGGSPEVVDKITAVVNFYTESYQHRRTNFVVSDAAFK